MKKQYLYVAIAIVLWATTAAVSKLLLGSLSSMQVLAASCGYASVFLLLVCLVQGKLKLLKTYRVKDYLILSGVGFLGVFLYNLLLFMGLEKISASQAFIINYLWPMMTVLAACVLLKEKLTLRKCIAVVMSFLGVIIITADGQMRANMYGAVLCVLAAVSYGLFSVLNKRLHYDKYVSMMLYHLVGFVASLVCIAISGEGLALNIWQHLGMGWIGIFTYAIAYVAWALAMDSGDTAKVANLAYITPFLSLVWNAALLGEKITGRCLLGLVVIVAGIFVQMKDNAKK